MPPKNQGGDTARSLAFKALDALNDYHVNEAETALEKADGKNWSGDVHVQVARAMWCLHRHRLEEATELCLAVCAKSPTEPQLINPLSFIMQTVAVCWAPLRELYVRVLPHFDGDDKDALENLVAVCAAGRNFKEMQRYAQDLHKRHKHVKYLVWLSFAYLMQIPDRRAIAASAAPQNDSLYYKLALRTLEQHVIAHHCPTGVAIMYVQVLESQLKFDDAIQFLSSSRGQSFGSWSERVRQCAVHLRRAGRVAEANSVFRHLWTKVDADRWDWFVDFRDTVVSPAAAFTAPAPADPADKTAPFACACGVGSEAEVLEVALALAREYGAAGGAKRNDKIRTPRLAALSLLFGKPQHAEQREALLVEHVDCVGCKSLTFFDLVKFIAPQDAAIFAKHAVVVAESGPADDNERRRAALFHLLAGFCNRDALANDDAATHAFAERCVAAWREGSDEVSAVASDIFVVAACSAYIRRAFRLSQTDGPVTTTASTLAALRNAATLAHSALARFSPHLPHVAFLSIALHRLIGSSDIENLRALDIKSVQHESVPSFVALAMEQCDLATVGDLAGGASRFHRGVARDASQLASKGLQHGSFTAFEELFATHDRMARSFARAESLALDVLVNHCHSTDTAAELRARLLAHRSDLREVLRAHAVGEYVSLEDRSQVLAATLHEEPGSPKFAALADFVMPASCPAQRVTAAKDVAAVLLALEVVSGESATPKSAARCLPRYEAPAAELAALALRDATQWGWVATLGAAAQQVFAKVPRADRATTVAAVSAVLGPCAEAVDRFAAALGASFVANGAAAADAPLAAFSQFLFPVVPLMVIATRILCDRQASGVKAMVTTLKDALARCAAVLAERMRTETEREMGAPLAGGDVGAWLGGLRHAAALRQRRLELLKRRWSIVDEAVKAVGVVEKLSK